jgi:hypothetical protein
MNHMNVEEYDGDMGCNDWEFPSYMSLEDKEEMIIKIAYWNDGGEEIKEFYGGSHQEYLKDRRYVMNFEVPFYLRNRLLEENIINQ